ncbi:hypothetical protein NA57DRAFT_51857 [Rhizodiscina lignyota]|uniref:Acetoacetate decarboxylase n=1 Tax=Rhizodiscina lignyota TaxID=1504668 RepID=A0A9P4IS75_9PEZI|nr:hypothetical protein NA57DRAFT_51857 [Rhizodiscina lignyota]
MASEDEAAGIETPPSFSWSAPIEIDTKAEQFLSSRPETNSEQEELLPREIIAEAAGCAHFQAELGRPLLIGDFKGLPAYLLRTRFLFQLFTTSWLSRVQAAVITIVFEDSPLEGYNSWPHPAIAAYYPELYEGHPSKATVETRREFSLDAGYMGVGANLAAGQSTTAVKEGKVLVQGVRGGGRRRNAIIWTIREDEVAKQGIPHIVDLPLIVTRPGEGRFSATIQVKAHYGFWRGPLARTIPVLGKNDAPVFFDPPTLTSLAALGVERGPDGELIAQHGGSFDAVDLQTMSSFSKSYGLK